MRSMNKTQPFWLYTRTLLFALSMFALTACGGGASEPQTSPEEKSLEEKSLEEQLKDIAQNLLGPPIGTLESNETRQNNITSTDKDNKTGGSSPEALRKAAEIFRQKQSENQAVKNGDAKRNEANAVTIQNEIKNLVNKDKAARIAEAARDKAARAARASHDLMMANASSGDESAQYEYGVVYENGNAYQTIDMTEAFTQYERSAIQNHAPAFTALERLATTGRQKPAAISALKNVVAGGITPAAQNNAIDSLGEAAKLNSSALAALKNEAQRSVYARDVVLLKLVVTAQISASHWNADTDTDGLIDIRSLEMLDHIRHNMAGTSYKNSATDAGTNCAGNPCSGYELVKSLDFTNATSYAAGIVNTDWTTGTGFMPIGMTARSYNKFKAMFDGNGFTINHLKINRPRRQFAALFSKTTTQGTVRNLKLIDFNVEGSGNIGGLIGEAEGKLQNIKATGSVTGSGNMVGGLIGLNYGHIINVSTNVNITGGTTVGGLVGMFTSGSLTNASIGGSVRNTNTVGGVLGQMTAGSMLNVVAHVTFTSPSSAGAIVGNHAGGSLTNVVWNSTIAAGVTWKNYGKGSPRTAPIGFSTAILQKGVYSDLTSAHNHGPYQSFTHTRSHFELDQSNNYISSRANQADIIAGRWVWTVTRGKYADINFAHIPKRQGH